MRAPPELLDRKSLERLERLTIRWNRSFQGLLGGNNVSRYAGVGHEFLDHRHFHRGDDLRAINWRAYMRLERLFLKMFRTEPRTPVRILIDTSESMACGHTSSGEAKFAFACRLAAAMCYIGLVRLETIILQPFASFLSNLETSGSSDFNRSIRDYLTKYLVPGLTFVISDFMDESGNPPPLEYLAMAGHEVQLVHVAGPADREPPWRGELELYDAESDQVLRVSVDDAAAAEYRQGYDDFCAALESLAKRSDSRYLHLSTATPLEDVLFSSLPTTGAISMQ
jgi:uncharacterized protein (DUF58 family)